SGSLTVSDGTVAITDDDGKTVDPSTRILKEATLVLEAVGLESDSAWVEGSWLTLRLTMSQAQDFEVIIPIEIAPDTAEFEPAACDMIPISAHLGPGFDSGVDRELYQKCDYVPHPEMRHGHDEDGNEVIGIRVPAGETKWFGSIGARQDDDPDNETLTLALSADLPDKLTPGDSASLALTIVDDHFMPQVSVADAPGVTEGDDPDAATDLSFAVSLSDFAAGYVTAHYVLGGTATSPADYRDPGSGSVVIPEGSKTADIVIPVVGDLVDEADETVTVTLTGATKGTVSPDEFTATGVITDDDDAPTTAALSADPVRVFEGAGPTTIRVTATLGGSAAFDRDTDVTVSVGKAADAAVSGTDYTAVDPFTVTISAGEATGSAEFDLDPTDDALDEADEALTLTGTAAGLTVADTAVSIADGDDAPVLSIAGGSATEGSVVRFTVTLTPASSQDVTARWQTAADVQGSRPATADVDYTAVSPARTLIIAAGETSAVVAVATLQDAVAEGSETFLATLSDPVNATLSPTASQAVGTIDDDDAAPTGASLSASPASVGEADGATEITVTATLDGSVAFAGDTGVTVSVGQAGDSAASGTDYAAVDDFTVTIAAGQQSGQGTFSLSPTDDARYEGAETLTLTGAASGLTVSGAAVTITDDDPLPQVTLILTPGSISESAGSAGASYVTAQLSQSLPQDVSLSVSAQPVAPATADHFVLSSNRVLTIGAGKTASSGVVTITAVDDAVDGPDRQVSVAASLVEAAPVQPPVIQTLTIVDDDFTGPADATASFERTSYVLEEDDSDGIEVAVILDQAVPSEVKVRVQLHSASAVVGRQGDVWARSEEVAFAPGETRKTVTLFPVDNNIVEPEESLTLSLVAVLGRVATGPSATVTLADDDQAVVHIIGGTPQVEEGSQGTIQISMSKPHQEDVAMDCVVDGTATPGEDYATLPHRIVIPAGSQKLTVTVETMDDDVAEDTETFVFIIANPVGDGVTIAPDRSRHTMNIMDDDQGTPPEISITAGSGITEGGDASFTVTASPAPAAPLTVNVTVTQDGDFGVTTGTQTVSIPTGGSATLTVSTTDDDADEPDGSVSVTVDAGDGYTVSTTQSSATVSVADNDDPPATPEISVSPGSGVTEGGDASFTVTASPAPAAPLTVNVTVTQDGDFGVTTGTQTVSIPTGGSATLTVSTTDDDADEPDGSVSVTVDAGDGYTVSTTQSSATVSVADNDDPPPQELPVVSIADASVVEGEHGDLSLMEFRVTLSEASNADVTIYFELREGTATEAVDYLGIDGKVVIYANQTAGSIIVNVRDDDRPEEDETLEVVLTDADGAVIADDSNTATGTIVDDD
ncbi:MAG: hypothetical protein OXI54_05675, partial [Chloroflexota bacterium]|nr:hypothetical protein [Chloroflexota bacterium]